MGDNVFDVCLCSTCLGTSDFFI